MGKFLNFTAVAAVAVAGYAVYFDYNRRTSATFRKSLKQKNAKHEKEQAKQAEISKKSKTEEVKALLDSIDNESFPTEISEKEAYFLQQVSVGEQLANIPDKKIEAALCFYKALAVYPNPTDILGVYQKTVPEDVYELIVMMIALKPPAAIASVIGAAASEKPSAGDLD